MAVAKRIRRPSPRALRSRIGGRWDPDTFGNLSERIARLLGTGRYLVIQTFICVAWIVYNAVSSGGFRFDPYPFILLTLALSLQAAYAAPLILLAQNRQDDRDRAQSERDRQLSQRTQAEAEFLARELASVRLQLADVVTNDDLDRAIDRLSEALAQQAQTAREPHTGEPSVESPSENSSNDSEESTHAGDSQPDTPPH